jgi:transketolase
MFKKISLVQDLENKAKSIRKSILTSLNTAGSGHSGGSLGLADIFTVLYFNVLNHDPKNPLWKNRDRLILSIGHVAPVLYASLAEAGYFPKAELNTLRKLGSRLQGHPGKEHGLPGLELSAGSLGQGLSVAVGMALADKIDNKERYTYCICGDGELQEGSIWEAVMSASHYQLGDLITIVDRNKLQIDGKTENVMQLEPLTDKWKSFGWEVFKCDGNNINDLLSIFAKAKQNNNKPCVILANTLMGKGIPSIENNYQWHGKAPSNEELELFIKELS